MDEGPEHVLKLYTIAEPDPNADVPVAKATVHGVRMVRKLASPAFFKKKLIDHFEIK